MKKKDRLSKIGKFTMTATVEMLNFILRIAESTTLIGASRSELYRVAREGSEHEWTVQNICRTIHSLKQRGYIEIVNINGNQSIQYTNRGKLKMIGHISERIKPGDIFLFVSFDIPEKLNSGRNSFRRVIKKLGFLKIQNSLWVINKNISDLVEMAAIEYGVAEYVVYIVSSETNIDQSIVERLKK